MKQYLQRQLSQLDERLPTPHVVLLPGHLFFCQGFEIPAGTPEGDVAGFARLQLEAAAPFPIESLAWGFVRHGRSRVLVYAATHERLSAAGAEDLGDAWQVMPGFVALCGTAAKVSAVRFASTGQSISALFFNAGESVPYKVVSRPLPDGADANAPQVLLEARAGLLRSLGRDIPPADQGVYRIGSGEAQGPDRMRFDAVHVTQLGTDAPAERPTLAGQAMWDADVRGRTFAAQSQRQRSQARMIWVGFGAALGFALLLLLGQFSLWGVRAYTAHLRSIEQERRPQVDLLESKMNFADNLQSIAERKMKPFAMIATASSIKPQKVHFERVRAREWNVLELNGQAERADQVTSYIETLRNSPLVQTVREVRTESRGGRTTFSFEVVYNSLDDIQPLTPKKAEDLQVADAANAGAQAAPGIPPPPPGMPPGDAPPEEPPYVEP